LVIGVIELLLVHVEPDQRPLFCNRCRCLLRQRRAGARRGEARRDAREDGPAIQFQAVIVLFSHLILSGISAAWASGG
jgi:hypothetical protein